MMEGVRYEHLESDGGSKFTRNVQIDSDVTLERGMLLAGCGSGSEVTVSIAGAGDTDSALYIAACDGSGTSVATVYERGRFNRSGIKLAEGVSLEEYEGELRRQGFVLTEVLR